MDFCGLPWVMENKALKSFFQHRMSGGDKKDGEDMKAHKSEFSVQS